MILPAGCRCHGDQLAHGGEDAEVASPDNEEAVDDTCGTAVVETLGEKNSDGLPGDENGAAEAEDGHEAKVTL